MLIERFVSEPRVEVIPSRLYALVRNASPCPWCDRKGDHGHEVKDDGMDRRAQDLALIGVTEKWISSSS